MVIDSKKLKKLFIKKKNIYLFLKKKTNLKNRIITKLSYDAQTGSYIKLHGKRNLSRILNPVINEIKKFKKIKTILDFGTGEMTSLAYMMKNLSNKIIFYANDISLSRLIAGQKYIKKKLDKKRFKNLNIFCTNHFELPFKDNSIDLITTVQSIEPNNAYKKKLLSELIRIARKGLVLMEPHYEIANNESKKRMVKFGYIKNFEKLIKSYNFLYFIIKKNYHYNSSNPNSIFVIIKKNRNNLNKKIVYVDPESRTKLDRESNYYYSTKNFKLFPIIDNITVFANEFRMNYFHFEK
jgi:ubiquinone/menaquinone biosynthesis C-methylase UbiE